MSEPQPITRRGEIRTVATRWRAQYPSGTRLARGESADAIFRRLADLDSERATRDEVDAIIGNHSWTAITCDGCSRDVEAAVQVGQMPDYDSATATLCVECLRAALQLLQEEVVGAQAKGPR